MEPNISDNRTSANLDADISDFEDSPESAMYVTVILCCLTHGLPTSYNINLG